MKNFLILGLTALLLFSISAALSLWLNQGRTTDTSPSSEKGKRNGSPGAEKEPSEPHSTKEKEPKSDHKVESGGGVIGLPDQKARLDRRAAEIDLVLRDIQSQREVVDNLLKMVTIEIKAAAAKTNEIDLRAAELEKKKIEFEAAERKNIDRMAQMYDVMAPESAAPIIKQMADSGRMDTAVKILATMKDRNAARVLAELADPALAAQLLDKMRGLKAASATPTPRPGGTVPLGGTAPRP